MNKASTCIDQEDHSHLKTMVQTRNQKASHSTPAPAAASPKRARKPNSTVDHSAKKLKSKRDDDSVKETRTDGKDGVSPKAANNGLRIRVRQVLDTYGHVPLAELIGKQWPSSWVVMVHILNALLSSTRISHEIAMRTLTRLVEANYQDLEVLQQTSWEQRTAVLTKGGYVRYREKTATYLGELVELVQEKYGKSATALFRSFGPPNRRIYSCLSGQKRTSG
jgi:hypothetical protein